MRARNYELELAHGPGKLRVETETFSVLQMLRSRRLQKLRTTKFFETLEAARTYKRYDGQRRWRALALPAPGIQSEGDGKYGQ